MNTPLPRAFSEVTQLSARRRRGWSLAFARLTCFLFSLTTFAIGLVVGLILR